MRTTMHAAFAGLLLALAAAVAGCGGGGGGDAGVPAGAAPQTLQLRTAWNNYVAAAFASRYTVGGTLNGSAATGSGSLTVLGLSPATFEGRSASRKTETLAGTLTLAGIAAPYSAERQLYFDSTNNPLGGSGDDYVVVVGSVAVPATARVGDSGVLYATELYTSANKLLRTGTAQVSFVLRADTATTALLSIVTEKRNTAGQLVSTDTLSLRITLSGDVTRVSETSVSLVSNTNLTFSY